MKKNKLYIFVISLIIVLIIGAAATSCSDEPFTPDGITTSVQISVQQTSSASVSETTQTTTSQTTILAVAAPPAWKTYTNDEYGFEFKYPEELQVKNTFEPFYNLGDQWRAEVSGDTNGNPVVSIVIYRVENESTYPRYFDTELRIGVSSDPQDLATCGNPTGAETAAVTPVEAINGITFNKLIIQDEAMMQYIKGISYRTVHNGTCFAIEQLKTGSNYRDESSPEDITDAELESCYNSISDIIKTFKFTETASTALAVGDSYGGGVIAYIFAEGDIGYVQGEQHGLIAATSDQTIGGSGTVVYSNVTTLIGPAAQGTAIGTGKTNTDAIMGQAGCESGAAYLCYNLNEGGYDDWFLPSKDELKKLYVNRALIGNFSLNYYWSSTESPEDQDLNNSFAYLMEFNYGIMLETTKIFFSPVRAVRYF